MTNVEKIHANLQKLNAERTKVHTQIQEAHKKLTAEIGKQAATVKSAVTKAAPKKPTAKKK
jgi:predicted RNA-binding protein Jag